MSHSNYKSEVPSARTVVAGLGALILLLVLLICVPLALVSLVGNPIPTSVPTWSGLLDIVETGTLPSGTLIKVIACVVWIWWSQAAISVVSEVVARIREKEARRLPFGGFGMQPVVVRLIAAVMATLVSVGALTQPAAASPSFDGVTLATPVGALVEPSPPVPQISPPVSQVPSALVASSPSGAVFSETAVIEAIAEHRLATTNPGANLHPPPISSEDHGNGHTASSVPEPDLARAFARSEKADALAGSYAEVSGGLPSEVQMERASDDFHRIEANENSTRETTSVERATSEWVIVQPGDTLWGIAEHYLGDPLRWREVFELNEGKLPAGGVLSHPNVIHPGWRLRLPEISTLVGDRAVLLPRLSAGKPFFSVEVPAASGAAQFAAAEGPLSDLAELEEFVPSESSEGTPPKLFPPASSGVLDDAR